ncbi:MAG: MFS transporter [Bacillota bacterium]
MSTNIQEVVTDIKKAGYIRWTILVVMFLIFIVAYIDRANTIVLVADTAFTDAFGITGDRATQGLLMTSFLLVYGICNVLVGPVVDRLGARKALVFSAFSWAAILGFMGAVSALPLLLLGRGLLGVGESPMGPANGRIIQGWFPIQERGKANSVWFVGILLAPAVAMPFIAWLISAFGWRGSFFALALVGLIPAFLVLLYLYNSPQEHPRISKAELEYITVNLEVEKASKADQSDKASIDFSWLKNGYYWLIVLGFSMFNVFCWGISSWIPVYLKTTLGFSWMAMGWMSALPYLLGTVAVLSVGYFVDRTNKRAPFVFIGLIAGGIFTYLGTNAQSSVAATVLISCAMAAVWTSGPSWFTMLMNTVPSKGMASAYGLMNGIGFFFAAFSPVLLGWMANNLAGGFKSGFIFMILALVLAAIVVIPLMKRRF